MMDFHSPKYICFKQMLKQKIYYKPQTITKPIRDSADTSLTLSQTDAKMHSQQSEISNLSTFYQSCEPIKDTKENIYISPPVDVVLKKTNSFHLNAKIRRNNKISRASKNQLADILNNVCESPQTRRKQVPKRDWEYSYRKERSTFFKSEESTDKPNLLKQRSYSVRMSAQQKSQQLKEMIDKAINNAKTFDEYLLSVVR